MGLLDFILNVAGLLLFLNWRALGFDPLSRGKPATLAGTIKGTAPKPARGLPMFAGLLTLLLLRGLLYWAVGSPASWTPKLDLGVVMLAFKSDRLPANLVFSFLSFVRLLLIFYFWLLALAALNRRLADSDPIQKLIRLHLGAVGRWPWILQVLTAPLLALVMWAACYPLLVYLHVINQVSDASVLIREGLAVGAGLFLTLKLLLPFCLFLHLITSYVYLGSGPFWDFVSATSLNLVAPFRRLPLRFSRLDFTPLLAVVVIFLLLHWLPRYLWATSPRFRATVWPQ
jgi:uncharacterized protein YggT (Ycf19 family)